MSPFVRNNLKLWFFFNLNKRFQYFIWQVAKKIIDILFFFVSAKWSSNEDLHVKSLNSNFREGPPVWTPRSGTSPNPDNKDFKPINFDSNSLKKKQQQQAKKEETKVRNILLLFNKFSVIVFLIFFCKMFTCETP